MTHSALSMIPADKVQQEFLLMRALCISHYAMLENSLVRLFARLMGIAEDLAGIPFFKMNNARSRNDMIGRLLHKKYGVAHNVYWNSLCKQIGLLDLERNKIVHWASMVYMNVELQQQITAIKLIPPNFWDRSENTPEIDFEGLCDFVVWCDFIERSINVFVFVLSEDPHTPEQWRELCQQPLVYPPPNNHPLAGQ